MCIFETGLRNGLPTRKQTRPLAFVRPNVLYCGDLSEIQLHLPRNSEVLARVTLHQLRQLSCVPLIPLPSKNLALPLGDVPNVMGSQNHGEKTAKHARNPVSLGASFWTLHERRGVPV